MIEEVRFEAVVSTPSTTDIPELNAVDYWPPVTDVEGARIAAIKVFYTAPGYGEIMRQWPVSNE